MILGLNGRMGAGKNTVAQRLALWCDVREVSFAAKLKESVAALLGCTVAELEEWKNDPLVRLEIVRGNNVWSPTSRDQAGMTIRELLQRYGTEAHRDVFGEDFWLDVALPLDGGYDDALYVVTDMRFPNEAQRVRDLGGVTVRVIGPDEPADGHRSEIPLACDYTIDNSIRGDGYASLDRQLRDLIAAPLAA